MKEELFKKLALFPDLELVLSRKKTPSQYFEHINERVSYYDKALADCRHAKEFRKLSFAMITKMHKLEKELLIERRKYKRIIYLICDNNRKVKIGSMLDGMKFVYSTMKDKDDSIWKPQTDALKDIIKEAK